MEHLDILNEAAISRHIGSFDVIYSFGVLHHTGKMYQAVQNVFPLLRPKTGVFYLALYPTEGTLRQEELINRVKAYRNTQSRDRHLVFEAELAYCVLMPTIATGGDILDWLERGHADQRGLDFWTDVRDSLGGWPVESWLQTVCRCGFVVFCSNETPYCFTMFYPHFA